MVNSTYIFGYGSLISSQSRQLTGATGYALPCAYTGLRRSWSMLIDRYKAIALNISESEHSTCNGVLIEVPRSELPKFDEREAGYERVLLAPEKLILSDSSSAHLINKTPIYAYITRELKPIPHDYKIQQSYVDVILSGCLEWGEKFTLDFVSTTSGWDNPWLLDRDNPTYPRPLKKPYNTAIIDKCLVAVHPNFI